MIIESTRNSHFKAIAFFIFGLWGLMPSNLLAKDVDKLYAAEVPILDKSPAEFEKAVGLALRAVLVKITGNASGAGNAASVLIDGAMSFLEQYSYLESEENELVYLSATFDQSILNAELNTLEIPVWGKERPNTFLKVLVDDGYGYEEIRYKDYSFLLESFSEVAKKRGLPISFYERQAVEDGSDDFLTLMDSGVEGDSYYSRLEEKYPASCMVTVKLSKSLDKIWEASWDLSIGGENFYFQSDGDFIDLVVSEVIDSVTDTITNIFLKPTIVRDPEVIELVIVGLSRSSDFLEVLAYLSDLDLVQDVSIKSMQTKKINFAVSTLKSRRDLLQSIAFGNYLKLVSEFPVTYNLNNNKLERN